MTGVILAGGENRRMGTDKAFLLFDGKPLIERILGVLQERFERTIIVTRDPERYRRFDADVVTDALAVRGPLTGIYTGLLHARTERIFVTACDMPRLNGRLIGYMERRTGAYDAVVPLVNGFPEPLHAIYHQRSLPVVLDQLRRDERTIAGVLDRLRVRYLSEKEIVRYDPCLRSFMNLNTPEEYKEEVCSDWECRS